MSLLLDDGLHFVALANPMAGRESAGFLERRCAVSKSTPSGRECIGTFIRSPGGLWAARVATEFDPRTGLDYLQVVAGVSRMKAIEALWNSRHAAAIADHL